MRDAKFFFDSMNNTIKNDNALFGTHFSLLGCRKGTLTQIAQMYEPGMDDSIFDNSLKKDIIDHLWSLARKHNAQKIE